MTGEDKWKVELEKLTPVFQVCTELDVEFSYAAATKSHEGVFGVTRDGAFTFVTVRCIPEESAVTVSSSDLCDFCGGPFEAYAMLDGLLVELKDFARRNGIAEVLVLGQAIGVMGDDVFTKYGYVKESKGRAYVAKIDQPTKLPSTGVRPMRLGQDFYFKRLKDRRD